MISGGKTAYPASEALRLPIHLGFRQRVLQVIHQLPSLGGTQRDIGHHNRLVNLSGRPAHQFLPKLVSKPISLSLGEV